MLRKDAINIGDLLKIADVYDLNKYVIGIVTKIDPVDDYYYVLHDDKVYAYGGYLISSGYIEKIKSDDSES